jgi:endonuclease/exonuclease/phosphatase family metal-dependent hydrolase
MNRAWVILLSVLSLVSAAAADLTVGTWNVRMLSANSRDATERGLILDQLERFDLVALQEVRDDSIVGILTNGLRARGGTWDWVQSAAVGTAPNDERYAWVWRTDRVQLVGGVETWDDVGDLFIREPSWASFRAGAFDFTVITVHTLYGDTMAERRAEAQLLDDVWLAVRSGDLGGERDVLLVGDLNLPPDDRGFDELRAVADPLFGPDAQTTIADNTLDNVWLDLGATREWTGEAGVVRFDEAPPFDGDDAAASLAVSDHRPLWATFRTDGPDDDGPDVTGVDGWTWGQVKREP